MTLVMVQDHVQKLSFWEQVKLGLQCNKLVFVLDAAE